MDHIVKMQPRPLPPRPKRAVALTLIGLWSKAALCTLWPLLSLACVWVAVPRLFAPHLWPLELMWIAVSAACAVGLWGLVYAWRHFQRPTWAQAVAHVDDTLIGRPLQGLQDALAHGQNDPATRALWAAHMGRMRVKADTARAIPPHIRLARFDPYALRFSALLLLVLGLVFGSLDTARGLPARPSNTIATGPAWEGWITPPAYTRGATLYLADVAGQTVTVPMGSEITLRLYGDMGPIRWPRQCPPPPAHPMRGKGLPSRNRDICA